MVDNKIKGLVIPTNDCVGAAIGQRKFFGHINLHYIEFFDTLVDDVDGVLAYQHIVLLNLFGHEIDFILQLVQLMHKSLRSLFMSNGF